MAELNQGINQAFDRWLKGWRRHMAADGFEGSILEYWIWLKKSKAYTGEDRESCSGDEDGELEEEFEEENGGLDENGGFIEEDMEQTTFRVEFEEEFARLDKNGEIEEEGMKQSTYKAEFKEEIAGLLNHDVFRQVTGEFVPTENLHNLFTGDKTTRLGSLKSRARGLVLRNEMVVKNLVVLATLVAKSPLKEAETIANGNIKGIWQDVSTKRRRFGADTGTIT